MLLRPLKNQLKSFSESNQQQIEQSAKNEYENNKLSKELVSLKNDHDRLGADHESLNQKYNNILL